FCLMLIAPVGHTARHCPHPTQSVCARSLLNAGVTCILEPRSAKSRIPSPWISSQVLTQSPQRIHLFGSRMTHSDEVSSGSCFLLFSNRTLVIPSWRDSFWSVQTPFFAQVVQSRQWAARRSSMIIFL